MLSTEVARRLEQKLGLGEFPLVRRRLYARLQRLAVARGDAALMIIAGVLESAAAPSVRNAGQYFCFTVRRRLEEAGLWEYSASGPNQSREQAAQERATVARIGVPAVDPVAEHRASEVKRLELSNKLLRDELERERGFRKGGSR